MCINSASLATFILQSWLWPGNTAVAEAINHPEWGSCLPVSYEGSVLSYRPLSTLVQRVLALTDQAGQLVQ